MSIPKKSPLPNSSMNGVVVNEEIETNIRDCEIQIADNCGDLVWGLNLGEWVIKTTLADCKGTTETIIGDYKI